MSMEVLLMTDVPDLGSEGDVVTVADGYARNYLLPREKAAPVTEATRRRLGKIRALRDKEHKTALQAARQRADKLKNVSCTIPVKVAEGEKLYGSVTVADIADALAKQNVDIDKDSLVLDQPIKELGVFDIKVALLPEVEATIKVWVVEE